VQGNGTASKLIFIFNVELRSMKKLFCLLLFALSFVSLHAQYDPEKVNKKAVPYFTKAQQQLDEGHIKEAIASLNQALQIEPGFLDAYLVLAAVYSNDKNYIDCIKTYEKAFAIDSSYTFEYKLPYSIALAGNGEFDKALNAVNSLLAARQLNPNTRKAGEFRQKSFEFAVNYAKKNANKPYVFTPKNVGDNINSVESEYFPCLTIDQKELVFTRRVGNVNEDFFYTRDANGSWSKAVPMQGKVNTKDNEGAQNISQDGQWLVFTGCNRQDGLGSCDIYISYLTDNGWSDAINMGGKINTPYWESQPSISPDKRDIYFSSRRPGGYGGSDIYVSHIQTNGKWSDPVNLGPEINTAGDEQCPFIHADNQTLYFISNGLLGYGDADLYYVRRRPSGVWSLPINLGYPINTIHQEGTLFISADGKTAYYSSDRGDSKGGLDIYSFELREDVRPFRTLWVKGKVYDSKTTKGLPSSVELIDLASKEPVSKVQTDEQGNYLMTLPIGKDYAFNVNRKGYLFYSGNFSLSNPDMDSTYEKNIALQPIELNAAVVLNNIFFDVNKFELKAESQVELDRLVALLNDNPALRIEISGHTDNDGKPADNLALSINRAKSVVAYLTSKGVAAARLTSKGYGETKPLADNKSLAGKALNRRTEMKVTSN
jgi:outer membrane protein OmpA-like peptidoglycan-associated protein/tetratricopeptide (TPR) repeat protein